MGKCPRVLSSNRGRDFGTFLQCQQLGMGMPTEFLTLNTLEWHKDAEECLLSDTWRLAKSSQKYYLSKKACEGILIEGQKKRNKELPKTLNGSRASSEGLDLPKLSPTLTNSGTGLTRPYL